MVAITVTPDADTPPWSFVSGGRRTHLTVVPGSRALQGRRRPTAATYRRRRVVVFGLLAAVVLAGWVAVHDLVAGPGSPAMEPIAAHVVVVRPGDTVWSIALASGERGDIRPLVDRLDAEVHGRQLQVGERLLVP